MPPSERIVVDPEVLDGKPVIRGTRLAVEFILELLAAGQSENDLLDRLAADERLPLDRAALDGLLSDRLAFTGLAGAQVAAVLQQIAAVTSERPDAASYRPGAIL